MSSFFGLTREESPKRVEMDAVLTRALCDNRKAIDKTVVELTQIKEILLRVERLLADNVDQSQAVSTELRGAARELCDAGCDLREAMDNARRPDRST